MLKLACHTWGFSDQPLEEAVQTIARLGFNYVDLGSGPHIDMDTAAKNPREMAHEILALLNSFNLEITDLYLLLPALSSVDEGRRLFEVKLFERLIPFALELGTPGITLSPGIDTPELKEARLPRPEAVEIRPQDKPDLDKELVTYSPARKAEAPSEPTSPTPFDYAVESFQRVVEAMEDTDMRISFEPHLDSVTATPEKALAMLDAVPGLSLTLDWAQFTAQGIVSREIEPLLQHTAHVQIRQAARGRLQTPYEEGVIDFDQVLSLLIANDYRDTLSIEYMNRAGWHGTASLDIVRETGRTRDEVRRCRNRFLPNSKAAR